METSARNTFWGTISSVRPGAVNDEIELTMPSGTKLVASITITTSWLATGRFTATARPPCIHSAAMPDAEKDSWSKLPQVQILCLF